MSAPPLSDQQLAIDLARSRDSAGALQRAETACRQLYERHAPALLAFLRTRLPAADLADAHQEVWRRAWEHAPKQFDGGNVRAWLFRIARNLLVDRSRRRRPEASGDTAECVDSRGPTVDGPLLEEERWRALARCLDRLPPELGELMRARLRGEPYAELCPRLGLAPERAQRLAHTALKKLQDCVGQADS